MKPKNLGITQGFNRKAFKEKMLEKLNEDESFREQIAEEYSLLAYDLSRATSFRGLATALVMQDIIEQSNNIMYPKENKNE